MSVVHINTELRFDELLKAVGQLNSEELEQLMSKVVLLRAKRRSPSLSEKETDLLLKINTGLPPKIQKRFDQLNDKRRAETLTPSEHKELLALTEQIEKTDAERMGYLAELAGIRGVSLAELMKQSEIFQPAHG